jgi:two-component system, LytTR family, sensor kinase
MALPRYLVMNDRIRTLGLIGLVSTGLGMLFFSYLHYSEVGISPVLSNTVSGFSISIFATCIAGYAAHFLNKALDKLLPWKTAFAGRFLAGYILQVLVICIILGGIISGFINLIGPEVVWRGFSTQDDDVLIKGAILVITTSFIYNVVYLILYSYNQFAVTQVEQAQNERKQLELQFEALKSQLSPHYLFNSLNTISSLIYNDPKTAEQFIRRLALTYQYILSTQHKKYVTLTEELEFVQSYYYLLRIRFQQSLTLEVNVPNSVMHSPVPPLTLQLLVENAVKHNSFTPEKPLFIYISAVDNTTIKVANGKPESAQTSTSFKMGIENIRKRYAFFTDKPIDIRDEEKFTVSLPVIKLNQVASHNAVLA